jgi:hypothetical protein
MLKTIRRRHRLGLAAANREWMNERLDNVARLVEQIRELPAGASAKELAGQLLTEAEEVAVRATYVDELTAKAA